MQSCQNILLICILKIVMFIIITLDHRTMTRQTSHLHHGVTRTVSARNCVRYSWPVLTHWGRMGRRLFQKFVRAGRDGRPWRAAGMDFWNKRHGFLAPIVAEVRQSGPWEPAVDGRPRRAAGTDFWNKRHGFLSPIVAEVRQSGPWTAGRDGPPGLTFETNGTDSWRRLLQKFVRAGRGRPAVTGRRDWLLKQTARIPGADCCRSSSERAVDGRPWRAAGIDFWNKRHAFLAPIVAEVRQSGPWTAGRDGPPGLTFETNGTDSWHRLLQKSVRAGRGSRPWTAGRDGPPGIDFWNKRHGFLSPIVAEVRQSGPWTAGRDGPPGIDFWNKRHGFLAPIVSKVCQIGPWWRAVDGWPWRAFISPTLTIPERRHSNTTCT